MAEQTGRLSSHDVALTDPVCGMRVTAEGEFFYTHNVVIADVSGSGDEF